MGDLPDSNPTPTAAPPALVPAGPSRRRLLQAAGLGAGAAALAQTGFATGAAASGQPTAAAAGSDLPLIGGAEFPIGIFWPPPPVESSPARYQEIADSGFNFIISGNYASDGNIFTYQLGLARAVGLSMLISDDIQIRNMSRWFTITEDRSVPLSITMNDARTLARRAIDAYGPYSSLAGFNLFDEPGAGFFPSLAKAVTVIRSEAPQLLPYINLLPGNGPGYADYVRSFVDTVKPSLVSFDRYPILAAGVDSGYFENLAVVRSAALGAGIPAWVYIQSLGYNGHRTPTAAEILWQINMALAYGYSGIQYFTYWTPDPARGEGFSPALFTVDGHRTERYAASTRINRRWLAPVGRQLKPLVSRSVVHANEAPVPSGATGFSPDGVVTATAGSAVVLGRFASTDPSDGTVWLLVANRSGSDVAGATLTLAGSVKSVARFNPATDQYVSQGQTRRIASRLDPGAAVLYRLSVG